MATYDQRLAALDTSARNLLKWLDVKTVSQGVIDALYVEINRIDGLKISVWDRNEGWIDRRVNRLSDVETKIIALAASITSAADRIVEPQIPSGSLPVSSLIQRVNESGNVYFEPSSFVEKYKYYLIGASALTLVSAFLLIRKKI